MEPGDVFIFHTLERDLARSRLFQKITNERLPQLATKGGIPLPPRHGLRTALLYSAGPPFWIGPPLLRNSRARLSQTTLRMMLWLRGYIVPGDVPKFTIDWCKRTSGGWNRVGASSDA